MRNANLALVALALGAGCRWEEGLIIENMTGMVVIPREAASRTIDLPGEDPVDITDIKLIGPVYLGLFPGVESGLQKYLHPEMGPVYQDGVPGDTYPYGGTTLGELRFGCLEYLQCRMTSGRFQDWDDIVEWYNRVQPDDPMVDDQGQPVTTGDYLQQICYQKLEITSDYEARIVAAEDVNGDDAIDALDLDFVELSDADAAYLDGLSENDAPIEAGDFAGRFTLWQQEYFQNDEDGTGFSLWGWMDTPGTLNYQYSTCFNGGGYFDGEYNVNYYAGAAYPDLLNTPSKYIAAGDWVTGSAWTYSAVDDEVVLVLDYEVQ